MKATGPFVLEIFNKETPEKGWYISSWSPSGDSVPGGTMKQLEEKYVEMWELVKSGADTTNRYLWKWRVRCVNTGWTRPLKKPVRWEAPEKKTGEKVVGVKGTHPCPGIKGKKCGVIIVKSQVKCWPCYHNLVHPQEEPSDCHCSADRSGKLHWVKGENGKWGLPKAGKTGGELVNQLHEDLRLWGVENGMAYVSNPGLTITAHPVDLAKMWAFWGEEYLDEGTGPGGAKTMFGIKVVGDESVVPGKALILISLA